MCCIGVATFVFRIVFQGKKIAEPSFYVLSFYFVVPPAILSDLLFLKNALAIERAAKLNSLQLYYYLCYQCEINVGMLFRNRNVRNKVKTKCPQKFIICIGSLTIIGLPKSTSCALKCELQLLTLRVKLLPATVRSQHKWPEQRNTNEPEKILGRFNKEHKEK